MPSRGEASEYVRGWQLELAPKSFLFALHQLDDMDGLIMTDPNKGFFAVDHRCFARACELGLNAAISYLVLARGTGGDNRTTAWSVNAIEKYTGIGRPRAGKALSALKASGLIREERGGKRPRYFLPPPCEIQGCEGYPPKPMTESEKETWEELSAIPTSLPEWRGPYYTGYSPRSTARVLVEKGWAREVGENRFRQVAYDPERAEQPDFIWLPNTIIDGASDEIPPIELVRQSQNVSALSLFGELYHVQNLAADGGVHWRYLRKEFERYQVGQQGPYTVWGFKSKNSTQTWENSPLVAPHLTGRYVKVQVEDGKSRSEDAGWQVFWGALNTLYSLGLFEVIGHLVEADTDQASVIHPYTLKNGEEGERLLSIAAYRAALALLTPSQQEWATRNQLLLVPVRNHITEVQMVELVRLRYRPKTAVTAAWFSSAAQWREWADRYRAIEEEASGKRPHAISR